MSQKKERYLRFPGGKKKALTLSYDDGMELDAPLVEMLRKAGMKCTFNISTGMFWPEDKEKKQSIYQRMTKAECQALYTDDVCEIAIHGYDHLDLPTLDTATACCQIVDDRRGLEEAFDRQIHGMAYPYGTTNDDIVDILRLCGVYYARTVVSTEKFTIPSTAREWLRLPATCHHNNPRLMELCDEFLAPNKKRQAEMFYLWGHTYEFALDNNWHVMEQFLDKMKGHDDIWYATNGEIYQAWKDFMRLESSADGSRVYNPTLNTVWFATFNGNVIELKPGETAEI